MCGKGVEERTTNGEGQTESTQTSQRDTKTAQKLYSLSLLHPSPLFVCSVASVCRLPCLPCHKYVHRCIPVKNAGLMHCEWGFSLCRSGLSRTAFPSLESLPIFRSGVVGLQDSKPVLPQIGSEFARRCLLSVLTSFLDAFVDGNLYPTVV